MWLFLWSCVILVLAYCVAKHGTIVIIFYFVVLLSSHELQSIHKPTVAHTEAHKDTINHMEFIVEE